MPTGAAIVGGAFISSQASGRASGAASDAAGRSAAQIQRAGEQARLDVLDFFPLAQQDLLAGSATAADIFGRGVTQQQKAISQGNLNAQQTIGGGFGQVRNALLGIPVDQSVFAPQGVNFDPGASSGRNRGASAPVIGAPSAAVAPSDFSIGAGERLRRQIRGIPMPTGPTDPLGARAFAIQERINNDQLRRAMQRRDI